MPSFLFEQIITLRQTCNYYPGSGGRVGVKYEEGDYRAVQTQHYIVPVFLLALGVDYSIPPPPTFVRFNSTYPPAETGHRYYMN